MPRIILLVGALALAVAGTTTLAFRTTGAGTWARPAAAGPLAEHLREMRKEMALPWAGAPAQVARPRQGSGLRITWRSGRGYCGTLDSGIL